MRNLKKLIIALFAVLAVSCTNDEGKDRIVIQPVGAPVLKAPATGASYVLKPENAANQAELFVWSAANYGGPVEIKYTIEIDKKGNNFAAVKSLGSIVALNQLSVTVEAMNNAALDMKATPFTPADYDVRIKAVTGLATPMYSNVINITITAYTTDNPKLWMPGSFQGASGYGSDWTPATAAQLASSGYGKTDFEGYVYINSASAQFKFTPAANWDNEFGEAGSTDGVFTGVLKAKPAKNCGLPTATASYYWVKADTDPAKLSYSLTPIATMGIIGNGTPGGWTTDTPMTYNKDTKKWTVTATLTAQSAPDNGMKFRANNDWPINYGDTGSDGVLDLNGANISTPAGTYLITLDLSNPRHYTYTMVKQ